MSARECVAHHHACECREDLLARALDIADQAMYDVIDAMCVRCDDDRCLAFVGEDIEEVNWQAEASVAVGEAVDWLVERGYAEVVEAEDGSGETIVIKRVPGED